eukprot:Hpha_TRINITY_DN16810_c3_g2::TRINITY_DN16810_c3_g2_i1::g.150831::m.150831
MTRGEGGLGLIRHRLSFEFSLLELLLEVLDLLLHFSDDLLEAFDLLVEVVPLDLLLSRTLRLGRELVHQTRELTLLLLDCGLVLLQQGLGGQLHLLRALSEGEGSLGLTETALCRGNGNEHEHLGIPGHETLHGLGQLVVPVRDVAPALGQGLNHVTEGAQTLVDRHSLAQALVVDARLLQTLTAGKIHQRVLPRADRLAAVVHGGCPDYEEHVRPRTALVHTGTAHRTRPFALGEEGHEALIRGGGRPRAPLNVRGAGTRALELQGLAGSAEEVEESVDVELHHRALNLELLARVHLRGGGVEEGAHAPARDTRVVGGTNEGVRLSAPSLTVREDAGVAPVHATLDHALRLVEHLLLGGVAGECAVEEEVEGLGTKVVTLAEDDRSHVTAGELKHPAHLPLLLRASTAEHTDLTAEILQFVVHHAGLRTQHGHLLRCLETLVLDLVQLDTGFAELLGHLD